MPRFAVITMDCNHTVKYDIPHPRPGSLAWCVRCQLFRDVLSLAPGPELEDATTTGYAKQVEITTYSGNLLPRRQNWRT